MKLKTHVLVLLIAAFVALAPLASAVEKKSKKNKKEPRGTPVLWHERDAASLNLLEGPGGAEMRPDVSHLELIREEKGGWSKKYRVRDARGRVWVAKVGEEAQSETAAVRIVWAAGYVTEINYLVPRVTIPGKGTFENVRFEARPDDLKRLDVWKWKQNPFTGTRELQGLKVLMVLLNNWDLKDVNNVRINAPGGEGDGELRYVISDLGATFGKEGGGPGFFWRFTRSRNNPEDYAASKFIDKVKHGYVKFHFRGKNSGMLNNITIADARWAGVQLSHLNDEQLASAFRAANYTPAQIATLTKTVRARINALVNLGKY